MTTIIQDILAWLSGLWGTISSVTGADILNGFLNVANGLWGALISPSLTTGVILAVLVGLIGLTFLPVRRIRDVIRTRLAASPTRFGAMATKILATFPRITAFFTASARRIRGALVAIVLRIGLISKALLKWTLIIGILAGLGVVFWIFAMKVLVVILVVLTILLVTFFLVLLSAPAWAHLLVNKPGEKKSGMHFFTFLKEGDQKIIEIGERMVRINMLSSTHRYERLGPKADHTHWQLRDRRLAARARAATATEPAAAEVEAEEHEDIFQDYYWKPVRWWARYVYWLSGAVFTGIYPFQKVYEYPLVRTELERVEQEGKLINMKPVVKTDYSDKFLARNFIFYVRIAAADTLDKISLDILIAIEGYISNAALAAYSVTRWDEKLRNMATSAVYRYTRQTPLGSVLSAEIVNNIGDPTQGQQPVRMDVDGIKTAILDVEDDSVAGFEMVRVDTLDITPNLDSEEKKQLYAEALEKSLAKAAVIAGQARADNVVSMNKALAAGGATALAALQLETLRSAIVNAKGGVSFFVGADGAGLGGPVLARLSQIENNTREAA